MQAPEKPVSELLDMLEQKLAVARQEYEQYFLGFLKKEPVDRREELETHFRRLANQTINNTALRFRYQQLKARFISQNTYWMRVLKQLEDGTYQRELFRLRLKDTRNARPAEGQARKAQKPAAAQPTDTVASEKQLKEVFQSFLDIRKRCNERIDNVQYEKMVEFMSQQTRLLKDKFDCKVVEFQVVEDGGKAKLKAIPRK